MIEQGDLTVAEYRDLLAQKKPNKYLAVRTWSYLCQRKFASKGEKVRGEELELLERAGEISHLIFQPHFNLCDDPKVVYMADFSYWLEGKLVVEDFKGRDTPLSRAKRAWVKQQYGITVVVVTR